MSDFESKIVQFIRSNLSKISISHYQKIYDQYTITCKSIIRELDTFQTSTSNNNPFWKQIRDFLSSLMEYFSSRKLAELNKVNSKFCQDIECIDFIKEILNILFSVINYSTYTKEDRFISTMIYDGPENFCQFVQKMKRCSKINEEELKWFQKNWQSKKTSINHAGKHNGEKRKNSKMNDHNFVSNNSQTSHSTLKNKNNIDKNTKLLNHKISRNNHHISPLKPNLNSSQFSRSNSSRVFYSSNIPIFKTSNNNISSATSITELENLEVPMDNNKIFSNLVSKKLSETFHSSNISSNGMNQPDVSDGLNCLHLENDSIGKVKLQNEDSYSKFKFLDNNNDQSMHHQTNNSFNHLNDHMENLSLKSNSESPTLKSTQNFIHPNKIVDTAITSNFEKEITPKQVLSVSSIKFQKFSNSSYQGPLTEISNIYSINANRLVQFSDTRNPHSIEESISNDHSTSESLNSDKVSILDLTLPQSQSDHIQTINQNSNNSGQPSSNSHNGKKKNKSRKREKKSTQNQLHQDLKLNSESYELNRKLSYLSQEHNIPSQSHSSSNNNASLKTSNYTNVYQKTFINTKDNMKIIRMQPEYVTKSDMKEYHYSQTPVSSTPYLMYSQPRTFEMKVNQNISSVQTSQRVSSTQQMQFNYIPNGMIQNRRIDQYPQFVPNLQGISSGYYPYVAKVENPLFYNDYSSDYPSDEESLNRSTSSDDVEYIV